MSFWQRFLQFLNIKATSALDRHEDPRETLEVAYQKQAAALAGARRGLADVLTAEKRLEIEANSLRSAEQRSASAAADAARAGDDARARRALEREAFLTAQRERVEAQTAEIRGQRVDLEASAERLRMRVELFRTEKLAAGARYAAALATSRIGETLGGLSSEMAEVTQMVERARERSLEAQARAQAVAHIVDAETVPDDARVDGAAIDSRLATLKAEVREQLPPPQPTE